MSRWVVADELVPASPKLSEARLLLRQAERVGAVHCGEGSGVPLKPFQYLKGLHESWRGI